MWFELAKDTESDYFYSSFGIMDAYHASKEW
jgi:hypothetical protein